MDKNTLGSLYIVASPIGNLEDITFRAIQILKTVDLIAVEDTRHSSKLFKHYGINTPTISLHQHNEHQRTDMFLREIKTGKNMALVTDAGTPLISDPGYAFVRACMEIGSKVIPIPGPCAAIAALSASGLPCDKFIFEGFLPKKNKQRTERLNYLKMETRTIIMYEAPHRILSLMMSLETIFGGDRVATVARELTKLFETIKTDNIKSLTQWMTDDKNQQRGEFVILVQGQKGYVGPDELEMTILEKLSKQFPLKQAVELTAELTNLSKNEIYKKALKLKKSI